MWFQMVSFILDVVVGLFAGAALLRMYMQRMRVPFGNPLGQLVFTLTDWAVLPLRSVLPGWGRWDIASLVVAFALLLVEHAALALLAGAQAGVVAVLAMSAFGLARLVISGLSGILIVYAVLTWFQGRTLWSDVFNRLCEPLLAPIRRVLPRAGGFDFSALVALVLLQLVSIALGEFSRRGWAL